MNRKDLQRLADTRIDEAKALLDAGLSDGAYYLAGYAVECALKACIATAFAAETWPDRRFVNQCHTHDLAKLVEHADLKPQLDADRAASPGLGVNWRVVNDWSESSRYERRTIVEANDLYSAITDPANGVLPWIKARW